MPKLLLINVALNWGSTGKIVEGIGKLALSNGWEVYVAHGSRYVNESELNSYCVTTKLGEILHYIESSLFDAQGRGSRLSTRKFLKVIDGIEPDIVQIHNIHGCFINYPILFNYFRERRIPVVWTLHDCWSMTGHCVHFERTHCDKWKIQCSHCPQKRDFPKSYLLDRSKSNYIKKKELFTSMVNMRITTVSSWLKGVVEQSYLRKFPIDVVYNGVDTNQFDRTENSIRERLKIGNKKMLLAVASGFEERKGIYDYVALSKVLPNRYQIVHVGVNQNDCKLLPASIIAVRHANGVKELACFYSAADVLLSLSYEETFGLTIAEAMSCGTPAVVYDNTAQPELITLETGIVVKSGDINAVLNAVIEICEKGKDFYFEACRRRAENRFDKNKRYKEYMDVYYTLMNSRGGG